MKKIVIEIDDEGNCSVDGHGFSGPECTKFIGEIQQAIGSVESKQAKPEYREQQRNSGRQKLTNGR